MSRTSISPAELYALTPEETTTEIDPLWGCYYTHIPEVDRYEFDPEKENTRVERRILRYVDYDGRRYWELTTVWFDGKPVMVVQNAGREGDDHYARFVTDIGTYMDMVKYLYTLLKPNFEDAKLVDPDIPRDDLLAFYGDQMIVN